jgi:hypothetical protein
MFGLLCYKPHLGVMIPVALLAGGEWTAIMSAAAVFTGSIGLTILLYGVGTWAAFLHMAGQSVSGAMDSGQVLFAARVDPTGAFQELGLPVATARLLWGGCLVAAMLCVAMTWRRGSAEVRNAVLAASALIAAPFALFYDLVLCSVAAAWLVRAGRARGFLPGEAKIIVGMVLAALFAAPKLVAALHVPAGAVVGPVLLGLAMWRWRYEQRRIPQHS